MAVPTQSPPNEAQAIIDDTNKSKLAISKAKKTKEKKTNELKELIENNLIHFKVKTNFTNDTTISKIKEFKYKFDPKVNTSSGGDWKLQ